MEYRMSDLPTVEQLAADVAAAEKRHGIEWGKGWDTQDGSPAAMPWLQVVVMLKLADALDRFAETLNGWRDDTSDATETMIAQQKALVTSQEESTALYRRRLEVDEEHNRLHGAIQ